MKFRYKQEIPFEQRKQEAERLRAKYPDRIPIIVQREPSSEMMDIETSRFLVPNDITCGQFMWFIRNRIHLAPTQAIFLFVNKTSPQLSLTMGNIYMEHKEADSLMYIAYADHNVFG